MESQSEKMKGELIAEFRGKSTTTTIKEISPSGVKIEINDTGQVTGRYNAAHMETVSVSIKTDGSQEWHTKAIQSTPEGDLIVITGGGKGKPTGPNTSAWDGEIHFMTQSPRLSWLNNTKGWVEGSGNNITGEFHGKAYALK